MNRSLGPSATGDRDAGFVLVWISMTIVALIVLASFVIDVGNWYLNATKSQGAADAAALAGVVFMPTDFAQAEAVARQVAGSHGYAGAEVVVEAGARPNQLRVEIARNVPNYLASVVGLDRTMIRRDATAEFEGPIPMGSPDAHLGNDPELGRNPQFYLNVAARNENAVNGERHQAGKCHPSYRCATLPGGVTNPDFIDAGYYYAVEVTAPQMGRDLVIQVFDPGIYQVGNVCDGYTSGRWADYWVTPAEAVALRAAVAGRPEVPAGWYGDAETRYARGNTAWCTGDTPAGSANEVGSDGPATTTYLVRAPDETPWSEVDNPVIDTANCRPRQFRGYSDDEIIDASGIEGMLTPGAGDEWKVTFPAASWKPTFANSFRRWVTVCRVPAGQVEVGTYFLQVRTSAPAGAPLDSGNELWWGQNRYALRAGFGDPAGGASAATGVRLYANGRLPIYTGTSGTNTVFHVSRVVPGASNRVLELNLWDISDAQSGGSMQVRPPADSNKASFSNCMFTNNATTNYNHNAATCSISFARNALNGTETTIRVPIPDDYTCDLASATGCWVTVLATFSGGVNDNTTWRAQMNGDPVRLVE